ncbi:MAG: exosortase A-associated hydrolase 2 [Gammaproteobacteria bacterium]
MKQVALALCSPPATPFFLSGKHGSLFCQYYACGDGSPKYRLVVIPPLGEELNKCRQLVAQTAVRLASAGCEVLVFDLFGTGDSQGHFRDCRWSSWSDDILDAVAWLDAHSNAPESAILTIRVGSLFLPSLATIGILDRRKVLMWQPVYDGEQFLKQLLRLRVLSNRFAGIEESISDLIEMFEAGESVEVAGYELNAELALAIRQLKLKALDANRCGMIEFFEFRSTISDKLTAPGASFLEHLRSGGTSAMGKTVTAEQFWTTQEISAPIEIAELTVNTIFP